MVFIEYILLYTKNPSAKTFKSKHTNQSHDKIYKIHLNECFCDALISFLKKNVENRQKKSNESSIFFFACYKIKI